MAFKSCSGFSIQVCVPFTFSFCSGNFLNYYFCLVHGKMLERKARKRLNFWNIRFSTSGTRNYKIELVESSIFCGVKATLKMPNNFILLGF